MSDANTPDLPSLNSILSLDELSAAPMQLENSNESKVLRPLKPEPASTSSVSTENTDWFTLAHKLHQQNQDLLKTVAQLEQALAESQQQLQSQVKRSRNAETLIAQQAEELHKLDSQQNGQHQQLALETLSQQLKISQQQVAQLERQFVLLQEESKDKTQKLLASEKQVRELQSRLQRQQHHTLQYKAALEQRLEVPKPGKVTSQSLDSKVADSPVPKVTSIQPWSSQISYQEHNLNEESLSGSSAEVIVEVKQPTREIEITSESETVGTDSELNNTQSVTSQGITTSSQSNLLSYRISPRTNQSKPSIDLPTFLRDRSS